MRRVLGEGDAPILHRDVGARPTCRRKRREQRVRADYSGPSAVNSSLNARCQAGLPEHVVAVTCTWTLCMVVPDG
jgi:hypothetical protein